MKRQLTLHPLISFIFLLLTLVTLMPFLVKANPHDNENDVSDLFDTSSVRTRMQRQKSDMSEQDSRLGDWDDLGDLNNPEHLYTEHVATHSTRFDDMPYLDDMAERLYDIHNEFHTNHPSLFPEKPDMEEIAGCFKKETDRSEHKDEKKVSHEYYSDTDEDYTVCILREVGDQEIEALKFLVKYYSSAFDASFSAIIEQNKSNPDDPNTAMLLELYKEAALRFDGGLDTDSDEKKFAELVNLLYLEKKNSHLLSDQSVFSNRHGHKHHHHQHHHHLRAGERADKRYYTAP